MSGNAFGPADPLSRAEVAAAVSAARPDWGLVDAEAIPEGIDVLYRVTAAIGSGERDAVLKCLRGTGEFAHRTDADFLTEVRLLEIVESEAAVPVPSVLGVCESHPDVPTPCYIMEDVGGTSAEWIPIREAVDVAEHIARESGRYLARIHDLRSFDAYGFLVATNDGSDGTEGTDGAVRVDDPEPSWSTFLGDRAAELLAELPDTRFADLEADLSDGLEGLITAFDGDPDPVLEHNDYRHGNLHVDDETGEIAGVLDWGAARAGSRLCELVRVEFDLSNHAPLGSPLQERIRDALFEAYEDERGPRFDRDASFGRRRRLYRLLALLAELRWFPHWYADVPDELLAEREAAIRTDVGELLGAD